MRDQSFILIEDSDTAKLCHQGWHDIYNISHGEEASLIYYDKIGYSSPSEMEKWLSTRPRYLSERTHDSSACSVSDTFSLRANYNDIRSRAQSLAFALIHEFDEAEPLSLYSLTLNGVCLGKYIASHLLRFSPILIRHFNPSRDIVYACLKHLCHHIAFVDFLLKEVNISYAYFSETVYFAGAIVEQLVLARVSLPYLFYPSQVTLTFDKCKPIACGKSLVYQVLEHKFFRFCMESGSHSYNKMISLGYSELQSRLNNPSHINTGASNESLNRIRQYLRNNANCTQILTSIEELAALGKPNIILYLHCFADGPHYEGFSGFSSSYQFFINVVNSIANAKISNLYNIVIKPHPNLLLGLSSPFIVDKEKMHYDINLTISLIQDLTSLLPNIFILDPSVPNGKLIRNIDSIHITSHGSVGLEARYLGAPLICTNTAPYSYLGLGEFIVKRDNLSDLSRHVLNIYLNGEYKIYDPSISIKCALFTALISACGCIDYLTIASRFLNLTRDQLCVKLLQDPKFIESNLDLRSLELLRLAAIKSLRFYTS